MKKAAFIPARSGSKGLAGKNIKHFGGKPLVVHTITQAIECDAFDAVFVSTDDREIAAISREAGACVPGLRSGELSLDETSMWDVVSDAISGYLKEFDMIAILQPTSPLRTPAQIIDALDLADRDHLVCSVTQCLSHPSYAMRFGDNRVLEYVLPRDNCSSLRQLLPDYYCFNGAVYVFFRNLFLEHDSFLQMPKIPLIMDKMTSIDIDDQFDWICAEAIYKHLKGMTH